MDSQHSFESTVVFNMVILRELNLTECLQTCHLAIMAKKDILPGTGEPWATLKLASVKRCSAAIRRMANKCIVLFLKVCAFHYSQAPVVPVSTSSDDCPSNSSLEGTTFLDNSSFLVLLTVSATFQRIV